MSEHVATVEWTRSSPDFRYATYNREHMWRFPGGASVPASAAPDYQGDPSHVDPEEAFVASLSSCHMLTFLALCTKKKLVVDGYRDEAVGTLEKRDDGHSCIGRVILRPRIDFGGDGAPAPDVLHELHEQAHAMCFIANSVTTKVTVEETAPV